MFGISKAVFEKPEPNLYSSDVSTPLTSVIGYFQLLEECETQEEREHYKDIIFQRLQTLNIMLDEFFSYAKLSQNYAAGTGDICDVRQILCETLFLFYDDLKAKGITQVVFDRAGRSYLGGVRVFADLTALPF